MDINKGEVYRLVIMKPTRITIFTTPTSSEVMTMPKDTLLTGEFVEELGNRYDEDHALVIHCAEYDNARVAVALRPQGHVKIFTGCGVPQQINY